MSELQDSSPPHFEKARLALTIMIGMILAASLNWSWPVNAGRALFGFAPLAGEVHIPMLNAAVIAAALMILTRCVSVEKAKRNLNSDILLAIAASFALSYASESTGGARAIAEGMTSLAQGSPMATLAMVYLGTMLVTELVTNNAAAALMFPLGLEAAHGLGVNHMPFVIAVMLAATYGFATPIGYQTNLMVYGPGGYKFSDYLKLGIPLDLLVAAITIVLAPLVWPF